MGASSSQESGQVAFVQLPNGGVGQYIQLALVPFTRRYFPEPASLAQLHALYCSDRVRASFRSGVARLTLQAYYDMIVVGDAVHDKRAARHQDPCPIAVCVYAKSVEGTWSQIGYFSCRKYDEHGDDCEETMLGMFKVYSGARASAESDVALAIIRSSALVYRLGSVAPGKTVVPWPKEASCQFNIDNSGTAGILSRLFRYVALHCRHDADISFAVSDVVSEAGVPQVKVRCDDATGLELVMETLSNDSTLRAQRAPSLAAQDGGSLWIQIGLHLRTDITDEPCTNIFIRQLTNDSNFPSPANKENPIVMRVAARVKALHDECKARARAPRQIDASSEADSRVAELLLNVCGLAKVSDNEVALAADVIDFQILMAMPAVQMHMPVVGKHGYAVQVAQRFIDSPIFKNVIAGEVVKTSSAGGSPTVASPPAMISRRDLVRDACRKSPWRVVATFSAIDDGANGQCVEALHDVVTSVMAEAGAAAEGGPNVNYIDRLVDIKLRGLISMDYKRASNLMFALLPVEPTADGLSAAAQAFRIVDDALSLAP